jgi:trans-aconitate methyltransferase
MEPVEPSNFYTGLVAELYAALRSSDPDVDVCARFVERTGQPALELGCGDGDPLLELRRRGLDVEGLDSSADMVERCRQRAAAAGLDVVVHHASMEEMDLGKQFRSIFLAGATFNLIPDDDTAGRALERIRTHLEPDGAAMIPLFVPSVVPADAVLPSAEQMSDDGVLIRFAARSVERFDDRRLQVARLRYERQLGDHVETVDRDWVLHWYTPSLFADLVVGAGLAVRKVLGPTGGPVDDRATEFAFIVGRG